MVLKIVAESTQIFQHCSRFDGRYGARAKVGMERYFDVTFENRPSLVQFRKIEYDLASFKLQNRLGYQFGPP